MLNLSQISLISLGLACFSLPTATLANTISKQDRSPLPTPILIGQHSDHHHHLSSSENVEYMTILGLMRGHLIVAKELLDLNQPTQAEPHIGHPVDELYADVAEALQQHQVKEFQSTLNQLHNLIQLQPNNPQIAQLYTESVQAVDGAIAVIPSEQLQSPAFVLSVIQGLLATAAEEYNAAIANGKIVETLEYQDSRGFILYAQQLYSTIAQPLAQTNPEIAQAINENLTQLATAWSGGVQPPATIIKTPAEVTTLVSNIDAQITKINQ